MRSDIAHIGSIYTVKCDHFKDFQILIRKELIELGELSRIIGTIRIG